MSDKKKIGFRFPLTGKGLQSPIYYKQMYDETRSIERDCGGNYWYLSDLLTNLKGIGIKGGKSNKIDFDMYNPVHKKIALEVCPPFSMVATKCGSMFSNGKFYVQDEDGDEKATNDYLKLRKLLKKPNILQSGTQFHKQVEINLKVFGFCPIYTFRAISTEKIPLAMWVIPPEMFTMETTGKIWKQTELSEVISKAYISWNERGINKVFEFNKNDYFIIADSSMEILGNSGYDNKLRFSSITDTLSHPINNWMAQIIARGNLIVHGGPKGIIYNNDDSEYGNNVLTEKEKNELNQQFEKKYGTGVGQFPIAIIKAKLGWIPLSFDTKQLMLHEESESCLETICNALGIDPSVVHPNSKYSNKEEGKKSSYQDVIIPDAENYAETLTSNICPEGIMIKPDYSHISCLQSDKQHESTALERAANALIRLRESDVIDKAEARNELSRYIDINP